MNKVEIKLYLIDEKGFSPCFGVDTLLTIRVKNTAELTEAKDDAKNDFINHLVENEGFSFSNYAGFDVSRDGIEYKVKITEQSAWGGSREGAGRPATGRKKQNFYITDEENEKLRKYLEELRNPAK